jgi:hypothetical protein
MQKNLRLCSANRRLGGESTARLGRRMGLGANRPHGLGVEWGEYAVGQIHQITIWVRVCAHVVFFLSSCTLTTQPAFTSTTHGHGS